MFTPESLGLGGVDYLQLFSGPDRDARQRDERISKDLKHLTLKHEIVFLVLSSLSRGDSDRDDCKPTFTRLREYGELEHDTDTGLLLSRADGDTVTGPCGVETA
jgi:replicative DNA helicase